MTLARICMSGAVAIADLQLPAAYAPQVQDTTSGGNSSSNGTTSYDNWTWTPFCSVRQACLERVEALCGSFFALSIFSMFLSFVILSLPDQVGDKCLLEHNDYWQGRMIANTCLYLSLVLTLAANYVASTWNPFNLWVYGTYVVGAPAAMLVGAYIWIYTPGIGAI